MTVHCRHKCMVRFFFNAQNLRRIKQRKGHCFIRTSSDDEDDKDDGEMSLTSPISL